MVLTRQTALEGESEADGDRAARRSPGSDRAGAAGGAQQPIATDARRGGRLADRPPDLRTVKADRCGSAGTAVSVLRADPAELVLVVRGASLRRAVNVDENRPDSAHEGAPPRRPGPRPEDPLEVWDAERRRAPVTRNTLPSGTVEWFVLGHPEALAVLLDPATFSSRVSRHLAVPSGMDPPEHSRFRKIVERYFDAAALAAFAPRCREIVARAIDDALRIGRIDALSALGEVCAVRLQCAYLGWSDVLRDELVAWQAANEAAVRERDTAASTELAGAFTRRVESLLDERRRLGDAAPDDPTTRLLAERLDGRPLPDDVIVSMVRNWTVGELGSITASIGILAHALAHDTELQARLRSAPELVPLAVEEVLRVRKCDNYPETCRVSQRQFGRSGQHLSGRLCKRQLGRYEWRIGKRLQHNHSACGGMRPERVNEFETVGT